MEKTTKRAERRHKRQVKIAKFRRIFQNWDNVFRTKRDPNAAQKCLEGGYGCDHYMCKAEKIEQKPKISFLKRLMSGRD